MQLVFKLKSVRLSGAELCRIVLGTLIESLYRKTIETRISARRRFYQDTSIMAPPS